VLAFLPCGGTPQSDVSTKRKAILAGGMVLALVILSILLLPRVARRIDSSLDPIWEKAAVNAARYVEMTNAYRIAAEVLPDHPARRLYEERKATLLANGYIETRELQFKHRFASRESSKAFFTNFLAHFAGLEFSFRNPKAEEMPILKVTARPSDFSDIERLIRQHDTGK